ncbi:hypothetical protein [Kordiimonas pumila]|uniref:Uncharacterized protein n=1 Tax=Kordiimonas pumila TaxID=2161677 RepID=A0ABV7D3R0_9PROT|nr:hypothetical protein [Kordiimonas pumila]
MDEGVPALNGNARPGIHIALNKDKLPHVPIVPIHAGAGGDLIWIEFLRGARGIIVSALGRVMSALKCIARSGMS